MPAGQQTHRLVPLSDTWYVSQLQTMVATLKIPMERRNKRTVCRYTAEDPAEPDGA